MIFKVILRPDLEDGGYNVSSPALCPAAIPKVKVRKRLLRAFERPLLDALKFSMSELKRTKHPRR